MEAYRRGGWERRVFVGARAEAVDTIRRLKALKPHQVLFAHCDHFTPGEGGSIES